jgi:hypothetical protein
VVGKTALALDVTKINANRERPTTNHQRFLPKQKGHPGKGAAFSFRENSSNGAKIRQNFLAKSYEPKKGFVKGFLGNKYVCFLSLRK